MSAHRPPSGYVGPRTRKSLNMAAKSPLPKFRGRSRGRARWVFLPKRPFLRDSLGVGPPSLIFPGRGRPRKEAIRLARGDPSYSQVCHAYSIFSRIHRSIKNHCFSNVLSRFLTFMQLCCLRTRGSKLSPLCREGRASKFALRPIQASQETSQTWIGFLRQAVAPGGPSWRGTGGRGSGGPPGRWSPESSWE
jgi:hypothetical protein